MNTSKTKLSDREIEMFRNIPPRQLNLTTLHGGITIQYFKSQTLNNDLIQIPRDVYEQLDSLYFAAAEILMEQGKVIIIESDGSPAQSVSRGSSL
ncbi:hypothetical protein KTGMC3_P0821 [Methanocalculus sp. MC3]